MSDTDMSVAALKPAGVHTMSPPFAHRLAVGTTLVAVAGALLQPMLDEHSALVDSVKAVMGAACRPAAAFSARAGAGPCPKNPCRPHTR
jgi:hypothetical protein